MCDLKDTYRSKEKGPIYRRAKLPEWEQCGAAAAAIEALSPTHWTEVRGTLAWRL